MITLRNGQCTHDPRLDRIRQVDLRSLNYPVSAVLDADMYRAPRSYSWKLGIEPLNQGQQGSCWGHAAAHELAARPAVVTDVTHEYAVDLYYGAQKRDPWPGGEYDGATPVYAGTSVLAGAQELRARGWIDSYRWALSIPDLVTALGYFGPVIAGVDWYNDMFETDENGFVHPTGDYAGGHAILLQGVHVVQTPERTDPTGTLDPVRSYVTAVNSWGPEWGLNGRFRLALVDLAVLWGGAEFMVPIHRHAGSV